MKIERDLASNVGNCNECSRLILNDGDYEVWIFTLKTISFRICENCLIEGCRNFCNR